MEKSLCCLLLGSLIICTAFDTALASEVIEGVGGGRGGAKNKKDIWCPMSVVESCAVTSQSKYSQVKIECYVLCLCRSVLRVGHLCSLHPDFPSLDLVPLIQSSLFNYMQGII